MLAARRPSLVCWRPSLLGRRRSLFGFEGFYLQDDKYGARPRPSGCDPRACRVSETVVKCKFGVRHVECLQPRTNRERERETQSVTGARTSDRTLLFLAQFYCLDMFDILFGQLAEKDCTYASLATVDIACVPLHQRSHYCVHH